MPPRRPSFLRKQFVIYSACAVVLLAMGFAAYSLWHARRALSLAESRTATGGLAFSMRSLSGRPRGPFDQSLNAATLRDVAEYEGDLYVSSRSGLTRYSSDGALKQSWHTGIDFPPFALGRMIVRRGTGVPELWIATDGGGAIVYDGKSFRQLLPAAERQRKLTALLALSDGRVVLGTSDAGVLITDGNRLDLLHAQFATTKATAISGDQDGLWIGTRDAGVWLWRAGEATHFIDELPDPQVLAITTQGPSAWIGTPFGIAEFEDGRYKRPLAQGVLAQSLVQHDGVLFVGTVDQGTLKIPLDVRIVPAALRDTATGETSSVLGLHVMGGEVVAVSADAVRRASGDVLLSAEQTLTDGHISALASDSRGRLWIGYFDRGLDVLDPNSGKPAEHKEDDQLFCINRIKEDPVSHAIAVATANGLALFDASGRVRQTLDRKRGLAADQISDLFFAANATGEESSLALATSAGITFLEGGSLSNISAFQGLINNHVYTIAGANGRLLAGTLGGFSLLENRAVHASYSSANANLPQNWITASSTADGSAFYLGTYGSGVIRVDASGAITTFREFRKQRIEINFNALAIHNGYLYAGTAGQGLAILRLGDTRWRFVREGLPSLNVTALAANGDRVYVGTDNGLVSMPGQGSAE